MPTIDMYLYIYIYILDINIYHLLVVQLPNHAVPLARLLIQTAVVTVVNLVHTSTIQTAVQYSAYIYS